MRERWKEWCNWSPFQKNLLGEICLYHRPGRPVDDLEVLAAPDVTLPAGNWTSLGPITNLTGTIPFIDTSANLPQRFYQARQLP